MRRTLGAVVGTGLALAAVGGWEWASGPTVIRLPGASSSTCYISTPAVDPTGQRLDVYRGGDHPQFWVYDGRTRELTGPWDTPGRVVTLAFDDDGRCFMCSHTHASNDMPLAVHRAEPGGAVVPVWEQPDAIGVQLLGSGPHIAVLSGGRGRPLRAERIDLFTGEVRRRLDFPDRVGMVVPDDTEVEAGGWAVSADGRWLALADGWRGTERAGPAGVEVWDFDTGTRVGRVFDTDAPADQGAAELSFSPDGRELWLRTFHRDPNGGYPSLDDPQGWDWAAGRRLPDPPAETPPTPAAKVVTCRNGLTLWEQPAADGRVELRMTAADGRPTADWVTFDPDRVRPQSAWFMPGCSGVVFEGENVDPDWVDWVRRRVGLKPANERWRLTWFDWRTGRSRSLRNYHVGWRDGGNIDYRGVAGRLVVAVSEQETGRSWLEVWPTPPTPAPPVWLWPLAAIVAGLLGWRLVLQP